MWKIETVVETYSDNRAHRYYYIYKETGLFSREYQLSFGSKRDYHHLEYALEAVQALNKEPYLLKTQIQTL